MAYQIQIRRDTLANWTIENPILADGEFGWVKDSQSPKILKLGDGVTPFLNLPNIFNIYNFPPGGNQDDFFIKNSDEDGDADWKPLKGVSIESENVTPTATTVPVNLGFVRSMVFGPAGFIILGGTQFDTTFLALTVDFVNWTYIDIPENTTTWNQIIYANGLYVIVGIGDPAIMISPDGVTWTPVNVSRSIYSVTFGNGIFVAVARATEAFSVLTSPDGVTWTNRTSPHSLTQWSKIAYGAGIFVAVSAHTAPVENRIMTSVDGIFWTAQTPPSATSEGWTDIYYSEGLFILCAYAGDIFSSPDGINWTLRFTMRYCAAVTYDGNQWVVVGDDNFIPSFALSPDGINWTLASFPGFSANLKALIGVLGTLFGASPANSIPENLYVVTFVPEEISLIDLDKVAGKFYGGENTLSGDLEINANACVLGGRARIVHNDSQAPNFSGADIELYDSFAESYLPDEDNIFWLTCVDETTGNLRVEISFQPPVPEPPQPPLPPGGDEGDFLIKQSDEDYEVEWGKLRGAVGEISSISDAAVVQNRPPIQNADFIESLVLGNGVYVAIVATSSTDSSVRVYVSSDLITWTPVSYGPNTDYWFSLIFANGIFVAIGGSGTVDSRVSMVSIDGINWTFGPESQNLSFSLFNSVAFGAGIFVAISFAFNSPGTAVSCATSVDGINWTLGPIPSNLFQITWVGIAYGAGLFVALGNSQQAPFDSFIITSPDGITWTELTIWEAGQSVNVIYGGNIFVLLTYAGQVYSSVDGISWILRYSMDAGDFFYYGPQNKWVVSGFLNGRKVFLFSEDGVTWEQYYNNEVNWSSQGYCIENGNGFIIAKKQSVTFTSTNLVEISRPLPPITTIFLNRVAGTFYGEITPLTGDLTFFTDLFILGAKARVVHQDSSAPNFVNMSGVSLIFYDEFQDQYISDEENVFYLTCVSDSEGDIRIEISFQKQGVAGDPGDSAYQIWLNAGNTGTEEDFLDSLKGEEGLSAFEVAVANGFTGTESEWLESLLSGSSNNEIRVIYIDFESLSGTGTIEEQICEYLNENESIAYTKAYSKINIVLRDPNPITNILYGGLYNAYVTEDSRQISSSNDWVVPQRGVNDQGWGKLFNVSFLGTGDATNIKDTTAGIWTSLNPAHTNARGLTIRPAGSRESTGAFGLPGTSFFGRIKGQLEVVMISDSGANASVGTPATYGFGASIRLVKNSTSLAPGQEGTYTGNDGKVYRTICIATNTGNQEWLTQNLAETRFRNGDLIPVITDNAPWDDAGNGNFQSPPGFSAMCWPNNDINLAIVGNVI